MQARNTLSCNAFAMQTPRRLLAALALALTLTSCGAGTPSRDEVATPRLEVATVAADRAFTEEEVRYLAIQAWLEAERRAFLQSIDALVDATPAELWRIMWCESGRPYNLPAYTPNWYVENLHGKSSSSGGAQFVDGTWRAYRGPGAEQWARAMHAPWFVQLAAANRLYAASGTQPWEASAGCWRR